MRWRIERVDETGSTNDDVRERALAGERAGLVLVAERQRSGRGRQGRAWVTPPGALAASVLLRPRRAPTHWPLLPLVAGCALAEACERAGAPARVKWPNDVLTLEGRKMAGILLEARAPEFVVVGFGVNVTVAPEGTLAAAVTRVAGRAVEKEAFLAEALGGLAERFAWFENEEDEKLLDEVARRSATLGREVFAGDVRGRAVRITAEGRLVVALPGGGEVALAADDVHLA